MKKIERVEAQIAVYNAEKQELIGIFENARFAAKFIWNGEADNTKAARTYWAARRNGKFRDKPMGFKMALRIASTEQLVLLGAKHQYITDKYKRKDAQ